MSRVMSPWSCSDRLRWRTAHRRWELPLGGVLAALLVAALVVNTQRPASEPQRGQAGGSGKLTHLGRIDGSLTADFGSLGIAAGGNLLYVAESHSLDVYDVSRPKAPVRITRLEHSGTPTLASDFAREGWMRLLGPYLTLSGSDPLLFDVTDPRVPRLASTLEPDINATTVVATGSRAYVAAGVALRVHDISDPTHPVLLGEQVGFGEYFLDIAVDGTDVYHWGFWEGGVFDGLDPSAIKLKAFFALANGSKVCDRKEAAARRSIAVRNRRAYVTCGKHMGIVDFAGHPSAYDRGLPKYSEVGLFEAEDLTTHVSLLGDWVLLTDLRNLHVLDVRDPAHIVELARFEHTSAGEPLSQIDEYVRIAMTVATGNRVYVSSDDYADRPGHVDILEIDRPAAVGQVSLPWLGRGAGSPTGSRR